MLFHSLPAPKNALSQPPPHRLPAPTDALSQPPHPRKSSLTARDFLKLMHSLLPEPQTVSNSCMPCCQSLSLSQIHACPAARAKACLKFTQVLLPEPRCFQTFGLEPTEPLCMRCVGQSWDRGADSVRKRLRQPETAEMNGIQRNSVF